MKFKNYHEYKKNRKTMIIELLTENDSTNNQVNIAIIIPHRNRIEHLNKFLNHINKLKKKSNHFFDIYVIDQNNADRFNRGILLNIGYYIAKKNYNYDRYIFHDVDSYPSQEIFNLYFSFIDKNIHYASPYLGYKYTFDNFLGGIIGFTSIDYEKINGYSSLFFGWGGEDDSFYNRCVSNNIKIYRPSVGSYTLPDHNPPSNSEKNDKKQKNILDDINNWFKDGIKQLDSYYINYKYFELENFLKTYKHNESNFQNNAELLYLYETNKKSINIYKIDYLAIHSQKDILLPKDYVNNKINKRKQQLKSYFQHPIKLVCISVIQPLIYWNEIKEKIINTYTEPKKFIIKIESNKRIDKIKNLLENEFKPYKKLSKIDLENTLKFIFDTYNEIIYIRIRNNKIECSYHIYSIINKIDWYQNLKYNNKSIDKSIIDILENTKDFYYTAKNLNYQPANNCLLGLDSYNYFDFIPTSYINEFIEMLNYTINTFKNVPDCDILLNRKDFAYLRKDNKYSYTDLLDKKIDNPLKKYWPIGCQSKKDINLDIPIPSADEWKYLKTSKKFLTKWDDKKNVAVFRGSSTGCGSDEYTNIRIKLSKFCYNNKLYDVALSKIIGRIKAYKENVYIIDKQKYENLIGSYLDVDDQSKFKYIFNVEGNAQAYRLGTEFRKKSLILNIKSEYYMWFQKLLKNKKHFIEINSNFDDLDINRIKNPEKIAKNGYEFSKKYINKKMIANYWYYYMLNINKCIY
jgi:hypothetical protein